jgi:TetR/AcrR family transcriptional regulator
MARPRAADHAAKRQAILKSAARLFAERGYDGASMAGAAQALGVSKALFYHYYPSKEALLLDIIRSHLLELVAVAEGADASVPPRARFRALVAAILACYRDADAEHQVQIACLARLPERAQAELHALERRLVAIMADAVLALDPAMPAARVKPVAMSVFGTLNWAWMWFRDDGPMSREGYVDLVTEIFAGGIERMGQEVGGNI